MRRGRMFHEELLRLLEQPGVVEGWGAQSIT
jgi:hypothetical protein